MTPGTSLREMHANRAARTEHFLRRLETAAVRQIARPGNAFQHSCDHSELD
jgi:hypothetical protein